MMATLGGELLAGFYRSERENMELLAYFLASRIQSRSGSILTKKARR